MGAPIRSTAGKARSTLPACAEQKEGGSLRAASAECQRTQPHVGRAMEVAALPSAPPCRRGGERESVGASMVSSCRMECGMSCLGCALTGWDGDRLAAGLGIDGQLSLSGEGRGVGRDAGGGVGSRPVSGAKPVGNHDASDSASASRVRDSRPPGASDRSPTLVTVARRCDRRSRTPPGEARHPPGERARRVRERARARSKRLACGTRAAFLDTRRERFL